MTFTEKLLNNINNCYINDPGFFWGFFIFVIVTICGIYLTLPVYRGYIGSEYFFKVLAIIIFFIISFLITLPIFLIEQALGAFGIEIDNQYSWCYFPIPIIATYFIKKKLINHDPKIIKANQIQKASKLIRAETTHKRKRTKAQRIALIFSVFFAAICVIFAIDAALPFLNSDIKKFIILFIGITVTCGVLSAVIFKVLEILEFTKKMLTK